jgi:deazaflavin-dependent oxidoreductase (nitroreductase family)
MIVSVDIPRDVEERIWPLVNRLMMGHTLVYRLSGGRIGHTLPGLPTMLLLDHVGASSGTRRTSPLLYIEDGENLVIVASKGGYPRHPGWFHNLREHPETTVQVGSERRDVHARVATPEERARLWPRVCKSYGAYRDYQKRTEREIPLVILEPRRAAPAG